MNKIIKGIILAVFITATIFILMYLADMRKATAYFSISDDNPNNPDRGFYVQLDSKEWKRIEKYKDDVRLVLLAYDLYEYRDKKISEDKLEELQRFLEEAQKQNVKCIFRGAYGFDRYEMNDADSIDLVFQHIRQIAPILNDYKEQIHCVQAGFFGPWGEWHSSKYLEKDGYENRNRLLGELLERLDDEMIIDVRRPCFIRDAVAAGLNGERLGFHNDGMFGSDSDLGTYGDPAYTREQEMQWLNDNLSTGLNGGEMPYVNEFSEAKEVVNELPKMKVSYLNLKYNEEIYEQWNKETVYGKNALDYISTHLGYRFGALEVTYPNSFKHSFFSRFKKIKLTLKNDGFAPISKNYIFEWVIRDYDGNTYFYPDEQLLSQIDHEEIMEFQISLKELGDVEVDCIGVRISSKYDSDKKPENCVEFVNENNDYVEGINYLIKGCSK